MEIKYILLMIFGFVKGIMMKTLINFVSEIDPIIVSKTFVSTFTIFILFSIIAFQVKIINTLVWSFELSLLFNLFEILIVYLESYLLFNIQFYVGLILFCGHIIYDTHLSSSKFKLGQDDMVRDALKLFLHILPIIAIFIKLSH